MVIAKWLLVGALFSGLSGLPTALANGNNSYQGPALKADSPKQYVVQEGDTLWSIASKYLQKPWQWQQLWKINPQLGDPGDLHPGDLLNLEMHNGEPQLRVSRQTTVKLSPKVRVGMLEETIPAVPFHIIEPFLSHDLVIPPKSLKQAPYVVGTEQERLIAGKNDFIYVYGFEPQETRIGDEFDLYRKGQMLIDPDTKKVKGMLAKYVGQAKVLKPGGITTLRLEESKFAVQQGDRMLPAYSRMPHPIYNIQPADVEVTGRIIAVLDGVTQVGENQVVVINRGVHAGLKPGDILGIYQVGDTVVDGTRRRHTVMKLPDEMAGELFIFRLFDDLAFGLVLNATQALHVYDYVGNLPG